MNITIEMVVSVLSAITAIGAILALAIREGMRRETAIEMKRNIDDARIRIGVLEVAVHAFGISLGEMRSDIKYIVKTIDELKGTK